MSVLTLGRYELRETLGAGGLGQVYGAVDVRLNRPVAIKVLKPELASDTMLLERFMEEAKNLSNLHHPNITTLFTLEEEPKPFMVMELVRGETLDSILRRKKLWVAEALAIMPQTIAGLAYAHEKNTIHRDIKPSNLMITPNGEVKVMDFGIARVRGSKRLTQAGKMIGTPAYMSPEQIRGKEGDERSDLYSLAIVLYEMLCGTVPFDADSDFETQRGHLEVTPPALTKRVPELPAQINKALMRALEKDPRDRFESVEAFGEAIGLADIQRQSIAILRQMVAQPGVTMPPPPLGGTAARPTPKTARAPEPLRMTPAGANGVAALPTRAALPWPLLALGGAILICVAAAYVVFGTGPAKVVHTGGTTHATSAPQNGDTAARHDAQPAIAEPPPPPPIAVNIPKPELPVRAAVQGAIGNIFDSTSFMVAGHGDAINLWGLEDPLADPGKVAALVNNAKTLLARYGGDVTCNPQGSGDYQCFVGEQDVAELMLRHGLAQIDPSAADLPASYAADQQQAQAAHLGLWAMSN